MAGGLQPSFSARREPAISEAEATSGAVLEIDLDAVAHNWRTLRTQHGPGRETAAVLKADGYGLGAAPIAARLHAEGCRHFFTAHLAEAMALRPYLPGAMLAVLHGLGPGEVDSFLAQDLLPALGSLGEVDTWNAAAGQAGRPLPALLHIDTGMNRTGITPAEARALAAEPARIAGIDLRFVMTHLVAADSPSSPLNAQQAALFAKMTALFPGIPTSFANSSGLFLGNDFASDLARPGAALYGLNPTPDRPNPMRPVATLRARVMQVHEVATGEGVGYDHQWIATRPSRIATLPVGYADGYHRALGNRPFGQGAEVFFAGRAFAGRACALVGRVSMDLITVDVTDCPEVVIGSWGTLIGPEIPPDRLAAVAGTNGYEILTSLGRRFHRVYLGA
ncbi:MAG TPA: alanine racemase [Acidisoma sp.]|uniref:alanine racemase n=1 Tax=Acidisoma sp. TaxID=1872115 RepID=UPI002C2F582D|nr:alanine racemase [Acidisoma sp.]HTH99362.1 alanine racemase [Acidisoma sp.]